MDGVIASLNFEDGGNVEDGTVLVTWKVRPDPSLGGHTGHQHGVTSIGLPALVTSMV